MILWDGSDDGQRPHPAVKEIKDAILACKAQVEVNDTVRHYLDRLKFMSQPKAGPYFRTQSIQIRNLEIWHKGILPTTRPKESE